jgi:predicted secreted hydrolase
MTSRNCLIVRVNVNDNDMQFKPVELPQDHNAHKNIIEWWYFNGHLKDKKGNSYSYMNCLFQADLKRVDLPFLRKIPFKRYAANFLPYVHFAHSVISDIGRQKNYKEVQNISLVSRDSFSKPFLFINYIDPLIVKGYVNNEIVQTGPETFHLKTEMMDLVLTAKKPVLLEQGKGFIVGCGRKSYYYSFTDLHAKGTIRIGGKTIEVEGKSWMDHQWADVAYSKDKWTWFSFQLEDGTDIMCDEYRDKNDSTLFVDVLDRNGKHEYFNRLVITPGKELWKSKNTKAEYPLDWHIEIPDRDISIEARSTMKDQEMIYGAINYWEGPLDVTATIAGKKIKGVGFMELVGYPSDYNFVLLAMKELNRNIRKTIFRR